MQSHLLSTLFPTASALRPAATPPNAQAAAKPEFTLPNLSSASSKPAPNSVGNNQWLQDIRGINWRNIRNMPPKATTEIDFHANLKAEQPTLQGATIKANPNGTDPINNNFSASTILAPSAANGLQRGERITIANERSSAELTYGGFTQGRRVSDGAAGDATPPTSPSLFVGNIFDATSGFSKFLGVTGTSQFSTNEQRFSIATGSRTLTFQYAQSTPNPDLGQFNTLENLAIAINATNELSARTADGRLLVSAKDATQSVSFANGAPGGALDWVRQLGLSDVPAAPNRFNSLQSLADSINKTDGMSAQLFNSMTLASLDISNKNPLGKISLADGAGNTGSVLSAFGINAQPTSIGAPRSTGWIGPTYNPTDATKNMASGAVEPQFMRPVTVYDAQGRAQNLRISTVKIAENRWAAEVYSTEGNKQLGYGELRFDSAGRLQSISPSLKNISVSFGSGAPNSIRLDWGRIGTPEGTTQYAGNFEVRKLSQNGYAAGSLIGIGFNGKGQLVASYSNGEERTLNIPRIFAGNSQQMQALQTQASQMMNSLLQLQSV